MVDQKILLSCAAEMQLFSCFFLFIIKVILKMACYISRGEGDGWTFFLQMFTNQQMDLHLHMYVYFPMLIHNSVRSHIFDKKRTFQQKRTFLLLFTTIKLKHQSSDDTAARRMRVAQRFFSEWTYNCSCNRNSPAECDAYFSHVKDLFRNHTMGIREACL